MVAENPIKRVGVIITFPGHATAMPRNQDRNKLTRKQHHTGLSKAIMHDKIYMFNS